MDCIECGCCDYVCPSAIPLVQHFRFAKAELRAQHQEKTKSDLARQRHARRLQRIEDERAQRQQKQQRRSKRPDQNTDGTDKEPVGL